MLEELAEQRGRLSLSITQCSTIMREVLRGIHLADSRISTAASVRLCRGSGSTIVLPRSPRGTSSYLTDCLDENRIRLGRESASTRSFSRRSPRPAAGIADASDATKIPLGDFESKGDLENECAETVHAPSPITRSRRRWSRVTRITLSRSLHASFKIQVTLPVTKMQRNSSQLSGKCE